jgi:hypothetical protein
MIKKLQIYFRQLITIKRQQELISWLAAYIKIMQEELAETAGIAHANGWRTQRYVAGRNCRKKIEELTKKLYEK